MLNTEVAPLGPDRRGGAFPLAPYRLPEADGGMAAGGGSSFDIATILRMLYEWRWLILGAIGIGAAAGIAATLLTRPMYRAWVTLEANPPTVEILDEKKREVQTEGSYDFIATQVGLLSSRSLAERVAQDLNLASDPNFVSPGGDPAGRLAAATGRVAGGLTVITPEQGQLIRFNYVDGSPQMAAKVANGVAESFISSGLQRKLEASAYARDFLQKQIAKTRGALEQSERALVAYAQQQGIINTSTSDTANSGGDVSSLQGASLVALNNALAEATARRIQAQGAYQQAQMLAGSSEVTASTSGLRQSKATLEAQYQEKRTLMKPDHPDMISLKAQIDELDRQISRERAQVTSGQVNSLLAAYRAAAASENNLRGQVGGLKGSVLNLRGRSIQYNILQRDVDTNRGLYDALLQRYKEIGVGGGVGNSPVMIVDRAEPPGIPYKPNLMFNLLAGLIVGLLAGVGTAFALEFLNDTIKTREDVRAKLGLACLGVVPKSSGKGRLIDEFDDPASPVSEAYSAILAALRFSADTGAPKVVLVTSANPSEGKSSTSLALAQGYARRGEKVILIDADLRRPAFKGLSNNHGVTNLLTSEESIGDHVIRTQHENLWLLTSGPIAPNPADLLSTNRFAEILKEASEHFDRVVIDGPPTLGLADATFLAAFAGHTMLVVEAGKTRTAAARTAVERIHASGSHIVGVTLTKSSEDASRYGYRYYRYGAVEGKRKDMIMISQQPES